MIHEHLGPAFARLPMWRQAFWFSYLAWAAIELAIWSRDIARVKGEREDRGSFMLIVVTITIAIFTAFTATRIGATRIAAPPRLIVAAGVFLLWAGVALRIWAVRTLGRFFRVTVTVQDDHRLVGNGPYRHLRNPSYTGAIVTLAGIGLAIGNWLSLAAMIVLPLIGFAWRIRVEEASLAARFGQDFADYRKQRWALIPYIW